MLRALPCRVCGHTRVTSTSSIWPIDVSPVQRRIDEIRPRPGDATEDNQAFLVSNRADRINHRGGGRLLEQLQQHRSGVVPTDPAEGTGRVSGAAQVSVIASEPGIREG